MKISCSIKNLDDQALFDYRIIITDFFTAYNISLILLIKLNRSCLLNENVHFNFMKKFNSGIAHIENIPWNHRLIKLKVKNISRIPYTVSFL